MRRTREESMMLSERAPSSRGAGASSARARRSDAFRAKATQAVRTLIVIPIIHTEADMGKLASSVRRLTIQKVGRGGWKRNVDVIGRMWADIRRTVVAWNLPWNTVRLYQDGLPRCEREAEIVSELARAGSPNHQLLLDLMEKGATLMGTESPTLLVAEYRLAKRMANAKSPEEAARIEAEQAAQSRSLLKLRDQYIAKRINKSLRPGETGILFLGMLHALGPYLADDIRATYPIHQPRRVRARTP